MLRCLVLAAVLAGCSMPTGSNWLKSGPVAPDTKPVVIGQAPYRVVPPSRGNCANGVCPVPKRAAVEK